MPRHKKVSAPSRRGDISLDIPFYRTFGWNLTSSIGTSGSRGSLAIRTAGRFRSGWVVSEYQLESYDRGWQPQRMELANQDSISDYSERSVEELLSEIQAAWNRADLHAYAALYARNAAFASRAGMLLNGPAEIEQHHDIAFAGTLRNTRLSLKARRISFLTPMVALVHADVELDHPGERDPYDASDHKF